MSQHTFYLIVIFWALPVVTWRLTEQARRRHWIICHHSSWLDLIAVLIGGGGVIHLFRAGGTFAEILVTTSIGLTALAMAALAWAHWPCTVDCKYGPRRRRRKRTASSRVRWRWLPAPANA